MTTNTADADRNRTAHFRSLSFEAQAGAIRRLAATGMTLQGISSAIGIAIEQLRRVIGDRRSVTRTMICNNPRRPA